MSIKISELPQATSVGSSDIIPIVQGGTTKQATAEMMTQFSYICVGLNSEHRVNITTTGSVNGTTYDFDYVKSSLGSDFSLSNGKIVANSNMLIQIDGYANPYNITTSTTDALGIVYYYTRNGARYKIDGISTIASVNTMALSLNSIICEIQAGDTISAGFFSSVTRNNVLVGSSTFTARKLLQLTATRSLNLMRGENTRSLVGLGDKAEVTDETLEKAKLDEVTEVKEVEATEQTKEVEGSGDLIK